MSTDDQYDENLDEVMLGGFDDDDDELVEDDSIQAKPASPIPTFTPPPEEDSESSGGENSEINESDSEISRDSVFDEFFSQDSDDEKAKAKLRRKPLLTDGTIPNALHKHKRGQRGNRRIKLPPSDVSDSSDSPHEVQGLLFADEPDEVETEVIVEGEFLKLYNETEKEVEKPFVSKFPPPDEKDHLEKDEIPQIGQQVSSPCADSEPDSREEVASCNAKDSGQQEKDEEIMTAHVVSGEQADSVPHTSSPQPPQGDNELLSSYSPTDESYNEDDTHSTSQEEMTGTFDSDFDQADSEQTQSTPQPSSSVLTSHPHPPPPKIPPPCPRTSFPAQTAPISSSPSPQSSSTTPSSPTPASSNTTSLRKIAFGARPKPKAALSTSFAPPHSSSTASPSTPVPSSASIPPKPKAAHPPPPPPPPRKTQNISRSQT